MRLADEVRIQLKGMNPVERESAVRELRESSTRMPTRPSPAVTMS